MESWMPMRFLQVSQRILLVLACALCLSSTGLVHATSTFASSAFGSQWQVGERSKSNFWGPLSTAHDGQMEKYKEAPGGQRLVQYFDKARMELTNPTSDTITNGLLTVELKTGRVQFGNDTYEQRQPARVNIAGDPGSNGPTYADLVQLQEHFPHKDQVEVGLSRYANGRFDILAFNDPLYDVIGMGGTTDGNTLGTYLEDPSGRYGQYVFPAFADFIRSLSLPMDQTTGYPTSPLFIAQVKIAGTPTYVAIQAFERRVLTYNPHNPGDAKVEFGNIGQHYYQWRYGNGTVATGTGTATPSAALDFTPFAKRWGHHGYQLIVNKDGSARADWRTYVSCPSKSPNSSPCEDPYTSYAGHAAIQFNRIDSQTAKGQVIMSNDSNYLLANTVLTLTLKPYDMAELRQSTGNALDLCGPDYSNLAPPSIVNQGPCGA